MGQDYSGGEEIITGFNASVRKREKTGLVRLRIKEKGLYVWVRTIQGGEEIFTGFNASARKPGKLVGLDLNAYAKLHSRR